ncbi:CBS domain-containing protein [Haloarcula nitratireducens]|uniref:CBS domain-containing protein n=1 Tax=Haloarcula nitratireducens TaxID=2487749 RepID=A0AAW4PFC6_9EURY|nr:CBS domain-containing protein [Halomicroarcula nitratireducens]MBX0296200.1 CBS domain-containing protein [Halomicroarcula nitratireducens]
MDRAILTQDYETATPETRAGKLRSTLEESSTEAVLVVDDEVVGAVLARDLLRSRLSDDAQAQAVMGTVPQLDPETSVREIARVLVENDTTVAPLVDEEGLHGVVTRDSLLEDVGADLSTLDVADVYTADPVTVERKAKMGEVVNELRENGISRLPVVDDEDGLVGVATTDDLVEFVVRGTDTADRGDRGGGEKPHLTDLPVENVMSRPAETTTPDESVQSAVETMFEKNYDGLVVVEDGTDDPVGVLTKTDVLRALTYTETPELDLQVTNPEYLRSTDRAEITEQIEEITEKYQELDVINAHVTLQKHDESHRGQSLMRCQIRLFTDKDQLAGTGEGYGAEDAFSIALEKLEQNVLELKGKRSETEEREAVLRKLHDI